MIVVRSPASDPAARDIEIVERKGLGHPDTICDALAEQVSLALSRHYFDRFNRVLHHNVDKILLVGGAARPLLEAAKSSSRSKFAWLVAQRRSTAMSRSRLTISRWMRVDDGCDITSRTWTWIVGADYVAHQAGFAGPGCPLRAPHGNPTCQRHVNRVRFAPFTELECVVLDVERTLNGPAARYSCPAIGQDIKVMGIRHGSEISLTIACAFVDRYTANRRRLRSRERDRSPGC